jgi:endoglucanase
MRVSAYRRNVAGFGSRAAGALAIIFLASSSSGSDGSTLTPVPIPAPVQQLQQQLSPGINLGNTLEAMGWGFTPPARRSWETAWGSPPVNQAIFDAYKAAGFKSVRIPVSWNQYADADSNIGSAWMARVKQVVDYARHSGLYVMINVHWDGGWLNHTTYDHQAANNAKLAKFWIQIATAFKDYDDHLLFAGTNEVGQDNTSGPPTAEYCAVQNGYNQTFVNAVRATGGNNATRYLVVQGYFTNIDHTVSCDATLPIDTSPSRLAMEVHYYDPYDFTLNGSSTIWQWGKSATDPSATETWANEPWVDTQFQKMKTNFVDKGVPVIVGEYGAYLKPRYQGMNAYRKDWIQYNTQSMVAHGLIPMWWDTGELFDRSTGAPKAPETIGWIVNSAK